MPRPPVTQHTRDSLHQRPRKGVHLTAAMPTHKTERSNRAHLWTLHASWVQRGESALLRPTAHSRGVPAPSEPAGTVPGRPESRNGPHFSCSSAGMLMFQPMACRSKPQVNRLHTGWSSLQAEPHTIRRWPCNQAQRRQSRA